MDKTGPSLQIDENVLFFLPSAKVTVMALTTCFVGIIVGDVQQFQMLSLCVRHWESTCLDPEATVHTYQSNEGEVLQNANYMSAR